MIIRSIYIANWHRLRQTLLKNTTHNNRRENRRRLPHQYEVGQNVFLSSNDIKRKLSLRHDPFLIAGFYSNGTVIVQRSAKVRERINTHRVQPIF